MATVKKRRWTSGGEETTARVVYYADQHKQRHIKTFKTKREAEAWRVEAGQEIARGIHTPPAASITVAEAGEAWIEQCGIDGLEAATVRQYRQHVDLHIKPFIGSIKLAELSPACVTEFRNLLIDRQGRSRSMAGKVLVSLGAILGTAMAKGQVARNVVRDQSRGHATRLRRLEKRHEKRLEVGVDIPTKEEIRAILAAAQGRWRPLIVTAISTGLSASELRGLRCNDVELGEGVALLHVRQRADRFATIGSPKSDVGKRAIPLAPIVVNTMKEWPLTCPKGKAGLTFPNAQGAVESLPNITRSGLGMVQKAVGLCTTSRRPRYGLHAFRHAATSLFIEQGFSPKRVQVLMGHSTIGITFDTYGHLFPSQGEDQAAMQRLQARLLG